jgi:hypothetical protein
VIELIPKGTVVEEVAALPLKVHLLWSTFDWTFELPICVVPAKNETVPVAGFPQLVAPTDAEMKAGDPKVFVAGTVGALVVVTAGVIVITVEAVGPAVKLASPL